MSDTLKPLIALAADRPLTQTEAGLAFKTLLEGEATPVQIAGFLMALRTRGESVTEYAAAAKAMRDKCLRVQAPQGAMDIVGTGGDGKGTLNISTATAFVVAAAGVVVAKHGNRNISSRSGAADALSQMGVEVMLEANAVSQCLAKIGVGFMMAPVHHPAMRHVMPVRQELGTRTIFNILGPLTNPAGVKRQLTGAFSPHLLRPMAQTLRMLGTEKAWLVHGGDGTDELSICAPSTVVALEGDDLREFTLHPKDAGLAVHPFEAIKGGSPADNAAAFRALLEGEPGAYRDAVLLNAAAALVVADRAGSLIDAVALAREALDSGAAKAKLEALASLTQILAEESRAAKQP